MDYEKNIEIPFGAHDSELKGWEYTIPEGMEAIIKDGKVIVREKESEDEKIRKELINYILYKAKGVSEEQEHSWVVYLEKQKEQKVDIDKLRRDLYQSGYNDGYQHGKEDAQKEQKPKMTPKWLYRLEFKDSSCGLWYDGSGKWCFKSGIGSIGGCKTKTLPMDYDARYKQDGRDWFSSCSRKEDLMHWYSLEDAKELISKGFVFTRYLATEYHEYEQQTVFIKETALYREEIDIFKLFEQKPAEWSEEDEQWLEAIIKDYENSLTKDKDHAAVIKIEIDFLKSIPERFNLQPKPEWSEEDRPSWKPSDEQMQCLLAVITNQYNAGAESCHLTLGSLYNDLKKLI